MLSRVTRIRTATLLIVAGALAACSSTTSGTGTVAATRPAVSTPDFPSVTAPAISSATPPASASASAGGSIHPAPSTPLRAVTVHAPDGTTYDVQIWADVKDDTCFDHAYGQPVVTFLTEHPCSGLRRMLATTTVHGRPVGIAISETGIPGPAGDPYKYSAQFQKLLAEDGTGSIDDLLRDGYRLPSGPSSIPAHEAFNVLGQDNGIAVYDAWYLDGSTPDNDPALIKMTKDIFLQL
jgi:hypothetical protein